METTPMTTAALISNVLAADPELTPKSAEMLVYLVKDSANYSYLGDAPLFDLSHEDKGYLTHLKKTGYLTTEFISDCHTTFAFFTDKTEALFKSINAQ
jgi:hypothetical protein